MLRLPTLFTRDDTLYAVEKSAQEKQTVGDVSKTATLTINRAAPISLVLVNVVSNQAALSWSGVVGATNYKVKRSATKGSGYSTVASVTSTS